MGDGQCRFEEVLTSGAGVGLAATDAIAAV